MRDLLPCPPCGRQGRPDAGTWQAPYHEPRGSAPRERDHRGGDHPVPSRTRQLSPPSPRVLQRQAAGGKGVALAEGAFLYARAPRAPRAPREARGGGPPCGPLCILRDADALRGGMCIALEGRWLTLSVPLFILGCPPPEGSRESFCGSRPRVEAVHAMRGARGMLKAGPRSLRGIPFVEPCCLRALLTVRFLSCRSFCVRFWFSGDVPTCGGRWDSIRFSHFVAEKD